MAEIVIQANGRLIAICVSAAWGGARSSIIRLIRKSVLGRGNAKGDFAFVGFDVSLYQGCDDARADGGHRDGACRMGCGDPRPLIDDRHWAIAGSSRPLLIDLAVPTDLTTGPRFEPDLAFDPIRARLLART